MPKHGQDKHTSVDPQDLATMVAALVKSDLLVIKNPPPKRVVKKKSSSESIESSDEGMHYCWISYFFQLKKK